MKTMVDCNHSQKGRNQMETKEIFDSIKIASEKTKIDSSSLSKVCKGKRETAGGYHWEYKYDL